MLRNTFCHIPRIGVKTEEKLWRAGYTDWDALEAGLGNGAMPSLRGASEDWIRQHLASSREALEREDAAHFAERLPASEHWRLYRRFGHDVACVDIETTGVAPPDDYITTIALYDGHEVKTYVTGRNLDDFPKDVARYKLLVTFNGKCFDGPVIEKTFGIQLTKAHLDLRFILKAAGVTGGLKRVEKHFGLDRGGLDGVDGYWAVLLWKEFKRTGDERFLETLMAYNVEDVLSLHVLAAHAYNLLAAQLPFGGGGAMEVPGLGLNPVVAHGQVLTHIRKKFFRV